MKNIKAQLFRSTYLWFEPNNEPKENGAAANISISNNFDYEKLPDGTMRIYLDVSFKYLRASILVRSGFQFKNKSILWDNVFVADVINPMVNLAIQKCYQRFTEQCMENHIESPVSFEADEKTIQSITNGIIKQYFTYRKSDDKANEYLIENIGLEFNPGTDSEITIKGTFLIIDEILYHNSKFDKENNQKVFGNIYPLPRYFTIKLNCLEIEEHPVKLSFFDSIMFYQYIDCALQMLLGNKSAILIPAIEALGMNKEIQDSFLKNGTALFKQLNDMLENSNSRITNIENRMNWNSLIR